MLLEGTFQEIPGTSQNFRDLGLEECSCVTRGDIPGSPRESQGMSEYVRNTLTSDGY